jgi:hypothetical protein
VARPADNPRRSIWLAAIVLAVALTAILTFVLRGQGWPTYVGLGVAVGFPAGSVAWVLQRRKSRATSAARRIRARLKVIRGGKAYDLEKDDSTDSQRYLM